MICFCSVLYYKDLAEHIRRYRTEKNSILRNEHIIDYNLIELRMKKFIGLLPYKSESNKRKYNKRILNKWHLILRLALNKELTIYRCHYIYMQLKLVKDKESKKLAKPIPEVIKEIFTFNGAKSVETV